jgi:type II restriction/modification system DNA methylase subunit YeeA
MPVNTAALKTFAPAMRRQLLEAVGRKLDLLLNSQTPDTLSTYAKQIAELREQEEENREQLLERVAYTWFNRLCALRYLDARGWHPFGCKVLMPAADGETQPELLKLMRAGSLPTELKPLTNEARLHGLLDGQIPPAISGADPQGEVYRELVLASSRSYHQLLPELFEGLDDASELLLPDDLLSEGSIAGGFRNTISDADCEDVEIIGWLYQFYISEKKDQVIGKVVKSEDIPAATQLFTPNWIVKYMVQNSLGAQWLATYPASALKGQMEFYIEPAEQTPEVQAQLAAITPGSLDPEALTLIDPACGSGHILVEAYDLLKEIYLERGYRQRDIPGLILTKNLYGLDICPRAAQLATFSLLMKGREDDRRLLERGIELNVMALQNSTGLNVERLTAGVDLSAAGVSRADVRMLAELFTYATTFGSLIQIPAALVKKLPSISGLVDQSSNDIFATDQLQLIRRLARQATILGSTYEIVIANPPYMGNRGMNSFLKKYLIANFPASKNDLFSCFIERGFSLSSGTGREAMLTMQSWMFLSTFQQIRECILATKTLASLLHLGAGAFDSIAGEVVQACAFVLRQCHEPNYVPTFFRLTDVEGREKQHYLLQKVNRFSSIKICSFQEIAGSPLAYWASDDVYKLFRSRKALSSYAAIKQGLATCNNDLFLRLWHEVPASGIDFGATDRKSAARSAKRWFPYNKGGPARRWYGNCIYLLDWGKDGERIHAYNRIDHDYLGAPVRGKEYYFKESLSWSKVSGGEFAVRYFPAGFGFDVAGCSVFPEQIEPLRVLAFLNSKVASLLLSFISPTINFEVGHISKLPIVVGDEYEEELLAQAVRAALDVSIADWNSSEVSWSFSGIDLLEGRSSSLRSAFDKRRSRASLLCQELARHETAINVLMISIYGLEKELSGHVGIDQVSLICNPHFRYSSYSSADQRSQLFQHDSIAELVSYATGCMMGRYSLDQPGLILADSRDSQAEQLAAYEVKVGKPLSEVQFKPDPDGIIPVLDGEWFEDDIVARTREFLEVTFPESTVTENLRFIEESLGKDVRKYFCSEFYKDHLQTYKKRPVYWMVQSPKKGFACLIYLHRYTKDTLNQVLNNYFRPYLQKLEARLAQLGLDQLNDGLPTRERTAARKEAEKITKVLKECQAWEQDSLLPLAQQRIELDLDDGVKVNYLKLQDVLAPIPGLAAKED